MEEENKTNVSHVLQTLRLDTQEIEALGVRNMPWVFEKSGPLTPPVLNVPSLMSDPLMPSLVPMIPSHLLWRSLTAYGWNDSLEIVEWIRGPKLIEVLDFDLWQFDPSSFVHEIQVDKFYQWLRMWLEVGGDEFVAERFSELEEEVIVSTLSSILEIQPEGVGRMEEGKEDDYTTTMDGYFHFRMKDPSDHEGFELMVQLLHALYSKNVMWAQSVLSHSSMLVRQESLEMANKWREARLADAGFVSREEGLSLLKPYSLESIWKDFQYELKQKCSPKKDYSSEKAYQELSSLSGGFLEDHPDMPEWVEKQWRSFEPELALAQAKLVLTQEEVRGLIGDSQISPENLLEDEDFQEEVIHKLMIVGSYKLIRAHVEVVQSQEKEAKLWIERAFLFLMNYDEHEASALGMRLARLTNGIFSAFAKDYENDLWARGSSLVRGALNVGLEWVMQDPVSWGFSFDVEDEEAKGAFVLSSMGVEWLFRLGWSLICSLTLPMAEKLAFYGKDLWEGKEDLLVEKVSSRRFAEARKILALLESKTEAAFFLVCVSVINRIPFYPEILDTPQGAFKGSTQRRAFETLKDIQKVKEWMEHMDSILKEMRI